MAVRIFIGDCRDVLKTLDAESVQCVVTSPPYYGLRDYGVSGQIGLEQSPDEYVAEMVSVFREVRRVLRQDGTLWLNLGDSYAVNGGSGLQGTTGQRAHRRYTASIASSKGNGPAKPKDLLMMPARVALALQADGWWLRSEIIWSKPNPMPESVTDRPTSSHEKVFLLAKAERYFYDAQAIAEPVEESSIERLSQPTMASQKGSSRANGMAKTNGPMKAVGGTGKRNARNVWTIATQPFSGFHFATMPPDLAERCILAGSRPDDLILDPFGGAGTTGLVADRINRNSILIELNPQYTQLARERIAGDAPLLTEVA